MPHGKEMMLGLSTTPASQIVRLSTGQWKVRNVLASSQSRQSKLEKKSHMTTIPYVQGNLLSRE